MPRTSTAPSSTASSSPGNFGPQDHEVSFEARTGRPVAQDTQKDLTKSETMEDSQVMQPDASSMASTVAWSSDQIMKSQASTRRLVTEDSITDIGLEATNEYIILSAALTSLTEKVNERVRTRLNRDPGNEVEELELTSTLLFC